MMASYSLAAAVLSPVNRLTETNIALMGASIASQRLLDLLLVKRDLKTKIYLLTSKIHYESKTVTSHGPAGKKCLTS